MAQSQRSNVLAAVLSFFIPGAGQLYKGRVISAIVWFCFVGAAYALFYIPGIILHFFCFISAILEKPK